jgi:hypothetical protein
VYIEAESEQEAKEKLLYITSQYGEFSTNGLYDFVGDFEITLKEFSLPGIIQISEEDKAEYKNKKKINALDKPYNQVAILMIMSQDIFLNHQEEFKNLFEIDG